MMPHPSEEFKPEQKVGKRIIWLGVAVLFCVTLIAFFFLLNREPDSVYSAIAATPHPTEIVENQDNAVQARQPQASAMPPNAVAIVDGDVIDLDAARLAQAVDRTMAQALGLSPPDEANLLERLINRALVLRAADAAGFHQSETEKDEALTVFLQKQGISQQTLARALAAQGLAWDDFKSYFGELLTADVFSQAQAREKGLTPSEYVDQLQADARISYGPAAGRLLLSLTREPETKTKPASTMAAGPASPAPTPETVVATLPPTPSDSGVGVSTGQFAPDFSLPLVDDDDKLLRLSDLRGRPVVLSFWTTWCPYCRRQTPVLVARYQEYADQGVQFVGVDVKDDVSQVEVYLAEHGIPYPIVMDKEGEVADLYEVRGFPTTYFLDSEGKIVSLKIGALTDEQLHGYLEGLLH